VLVVIIVALLFRSLVAGILSGFTLALAMAFLFGLMGLLDIELNLPTAMLSSIMIGVGVDYTIHFLWRYREERRRADDRATAVFRTLTTSGRGIIINALSVIVGFSVMFFSSFVPVRYFGFLVVVSIGACLLGAMVLMPALVLLFKPRFLEPRGAGKAA
jgi:predicted RND superfamily exporter protein